MKLVVVASYYNFYIAWFTIALNFAAAEPSYAVFFRHCAIRLYHLETLVFLAYADYSVAKCQKNNDRVSSIIINRLMTESKDKKETFSVPRVKCVLLLWFG